MSFNADSFELDIQSKVESTGKFGDKIFRIYDPAVLAELVSKMNPPICGIMYEGIVSETNQGDTGVTSFLSVSLFILLDKKERDIRQAVDKASVASMLDATRSAIIRTLSPAYTPWEFGMEIPFAISDRDLGYYQKWKAKVSV